MSNKPLNGIKIIDFTHVQAGPACTQMLAWFGADVIKVERPGAGDVTRSQLRDIPDVDALYFTMLNSNKRSLTLDTKKPEGKAVLEKLIKECDVLVENFGPGALDRMGFTWERIQELNPKMILASVKGLSLPRPAFWTMMSEMARVRRKGVSDSLSTTSPMNPNPLLVWLMAMLSMDRNAGRGCSSAKNSWCAFCRL